MARNITSAYYGNRTPTTACFSYRRCLFATQSVWRNHIKSLIHTKSTGKIDPQKKKINKQKHMMAKKKRKRKKNVNRLNPLRVLCCAIWGWRKYNKTYTTNQERMAILFFRHPFEFAVNLVGFCVCVCENNHRRSVKMCFGAYAK